ncbi:MAG: hypothetical protein K1X78_11535 [Verrucomicrobiaceae bacterium]|nr:hypothetical protein [Verrucomicrobiaceae bacterium]
MPADRTTRLIAVILLLLLVGWAVRWWRARTVTEEAEMLRLPGVEEAPEESRVLPRE